MRLDPVRWRSWGVAAAVAAGATGCAGAPPATAPEAPAPIDLAPRCLEIPNAPALSGSSDAPGSLGRPTASEPSHARPGPGALVASERFGGLRAWTVSTPSAALESIAWGFGPVDPRDAFALEIGAQLLRDGLTQAAPEAFRRRVRALGGGSAVHVEEGWLWLELRFAPQAREAAIALLADWGTLDRVDPEPFGATRRSVALRQLAADASPARIASRAFDRLAARPEGAVAATEVAADRPEADPESVDALLRRVMQPEGSVLLHSETSAIEAGVPLSESLRRALATQGAVAPEDRNADDPPAPSPAKARAPLGAEPDSLYVVDRPGSPQVEILIGLPTVGPSHPDAAALEMLASLLGADVGGRLFRDLRERQGLAYIIDAEQRPEGRFVVSTRARPGRVAALLVGIEAHLRALHSEPLLACEVRMLRRRMAGEEALLVDDAEALRARLRAEVAQRGGPLDSAERAARYAGRDGAGRDGEALGAIARRHLAGSPIVVLVGEEALLRGSLAIALPDRPIRVFDAELDDAR